MKEDFLQFVWKHSLYERTDLKTLSGEHLEVISAGTWNADSGPDFFNSMLKIGETKWCGNVEVHLRSSNWFLHNHQTDKAYENVILHVVLDDDKPVSYSNGFLIPVFIPQIAQSVIENYERLLGEESWPACHNDLSCIDPIYKLSVLDSLLVRRLQGKSEKIVDLLNQNKNDWNESFYQCLAQNFGFKTNKLPFEILSRSLPLRILSKYKTDLFKLEALLFGQSGMLNDQLLGDDYYLALRNEYSYLAQKHKLQGMESHLWKYMRLRPANFPTIRIAQFARLVNQSESLFSKLLEIEDPEAMIALFDVSASEYWDCHYKFNIESKKCSKRLGTLARNILLINTVVPFLFVYGDRNNKPELKNRAVDLLERLPAEENNIVERWIELGFSPQNAADTQALIELKNEFCDKKRCLQCQLGAKIIADEFGKMHK